MGARLNWRRFGSPARLRSSAAATARPNLDKQLRSASVFFNKLQNSLCVMLFDPVNHKAVRCQQTQHISVIDGLKRADPGIELLLGKVSL